MKQHLPQTMRQTLDHRRWFTIWQICVFQLKLNFPAKSTTSAKALTHTGNRFECNKKKRINLTSPTAVNRKYGRILHNRWVNKLTPFYLARQLRSRLARNHLKAICESYTPEEHWSALVFPNPYRIILFPVQG